MSYSSYDHDDLEPASTMRIERRIYFESGKADLSELVKLPLAELLSLRAESAVAEQEVFDRLKEQAAAWEEQAGRTLFLDKALEYARTLPVTHTANQWEAPDEYRHIRSNMVYQMDYSISENTRYDSAAQKSVPYSWTLRWSLRTNAPGSYRQAKIAGQDRKVFASREELDKYLNGRIKAHDHYFTEISPAIPKEYADCFKVNGCLLPGYTIEGEEPAKAAALPTQEEAAQPQQTTATPERREPVNEVFSIFLDNRAEAQTGGPHGYWLSLPTTAEQVQEALKEIHITADNQQDLFIDGFSAPEGKPLELPEDLIKAASVDELNFLAAQLQRLDAVELAELNAAMQSPAKMQTIGQLLDYAENTDCFVLINAKDNRSLGEYYLNDSGLFVVPDPWKPAIDTDRLGSFIANEEQGTFTDYGYILRTSDEWQRVHEGQPVPEPYRVMAYPAPEILREESKVQPEAAAPTKAPQPVTPILLKKSFLLLSLSCLAVAFLLLGAVIFLCRGIENHYPLGGVEILSDGSVVPLPSPTVSQQRILATLNIVQTVSCILFPVGGLIVSVFLFYYLKLKQPISCLQNGIMRIQNNDLDFSLPILSNDEMGQLCAAFEEMRSELLKSNRLLWQQAEERKRLNAAFSHDLRNPITVLKGSVKLLRQGIQDEQTIDRLESYTLRIEQYVEAMSSVQKLEQLSVKPKEIRLSVLQSELQETARLLALSKKVSVLVPSDGTVCIDHGLFLTVAENLIGNAARFAEKAISIQITLQNDSLVLKVEDDGAGYPLSLVQNGPNPFETTSSNSSHFGMGLYSSRILCEKHGGRLILENRAGGGASATAIFYFA